MLSDLARIAIVFIIFTLVTAVFSTPFAKADKKITIGVLSPLTGPYRFEAESQRDFAYLAAAEINAQGGVLGRQIDIVVEDTELKAGVGTAKARKLIDNDVKYLTGGLSSTVVGAISNLAHKAGVLHLGIGGANSLTGENCNRHHFNLDTAAYQMAIGTGTVVLDKIGLPNDWFCITADYSWGHTTLDSVKKVLANRGGKVVQNVMTVIRENDYSPALVKAMTSDASVLCVIVWGAGQVRLLEQAYEFGVQNKMDIVVIVSGYNIISKTAPRALRGVYMGIPWYWNIDNETTQSLSKKYIDKYGQPGDWPGAQVYDSIKVLTTAMEKAGSFEVDKLIPVLEGMEFQTSKGPERIRACDHRAVQDWYVGIGNPPHIRKNKWDLLKIIGQVGGDEIMYPCEETGCTINQRTPN